MEFHAKIGERRVSVQDGGTTSDVWVGFSSVSQKPTLHSEPSYYFTPIRGSRFEVEKESRESKTKK